MNRIRLRHRLIHRSTPGDVGVRQTLGVSPTHGTTPAAAAGALELGGTPVARMGFGTLRLPSVRDARDSREAHRILRRVVELGVQLIDTADVYGPETAELLVSDALAPYPPGVLIATKGGMSPRHGGAWTAGGSPEWLRTACEASLRRLRTDTIDLYQLHKPDPAVPIEDSVGAIARLRDEGKVRLVGVSNVSADELRRAMTTTPIASVQNRLSVVEAEDRAVLALCEENGIAYLPWYPLGCGSLARGPGAIAAVAERHGATPAQVALAWLLAYAPVMLPIPGTGSMEHLEENIAAASLILDDDDMALLAP